MTTSPAQANPGDLDYRPVPVMALTYHDVQGDADPHSGFSGAGPDRYRLSPVSFGRHLDVIAASGVTPRLVAQPPGTSERHVFLTFDDGGVSAGTTIHPLLLERGWRGHFFITVEKIGAPHFVAADDLRDMRGCGHVIGSHGHSHRMLTRLSDDAVAEEWRKSKAILEDILGESVTDVSVPTGAYSRRVGRLAIEAGYRNVFTSEPWLRPRELGDGWVYGRFSVTSETPPEQVARLCHFSRQEILRNAAHWQARKVVKLTLGERYETLRRVVLESRHRR